MQSFSIFSIMTAGIQSGSYLVAFGRMFERASYYGIRALIVFYAIEQLGMSRHDTLGYYGSMTALTYVFMMVGGLLGDLLRINKWLILGAGIVQVASILLFMSGIKQLVIIGGICFAIGSGVYTISSLTAYGRLQYGKLKSLLGNWTLYYVLVMVGTFFGIWFSNVQTAEFKYHFVFYAAIAALVISTTLAFLGASQVPSVVRKRATSNGLGTILIILTVLCSALYWYTMEIAGSETSFWLVQLRDAGIVSNTFFNLDLNFYVLAAGGVLIIILSRVMKMSSLLIIALGLIFSAIAFSMMTIQLEIENVYSLIVFHTILYSIAEFLIFPAILSVQNMYSNPKYLGIIFGACMLSVMLLNRYIFGAIFPDIPPSFFKWGIFILSGALFVVGVVWFVLHFFFKDSFGYVPIDSEEHIELKDGEILD